MALDPRRGRWVNLGNSDYAMLRQIFAGRVQPDDVLVDVGCGAGRVLNFWLDQGYTNRMVGLERDAVLAASTRRRLQSHRNVEVVTGDAIETLPRDGTVYYLFNPFDAGDMARLADRMLKVSLRRESRLLIVYYNCKHVSVFDGDGNWSIERAELSAPRFAPPSPLAYITPKHQLPGA